jgi:acylphosphatase
VTTRRIRFLVVGRVQGVGFRAHTQQAAHGLALVGFVRNRRDGAVEGEAEGDAAEVAAFTEWLQTGSPWSRVERVEIEEMPANGADATFAVLR